MARGAICLILSMFIRQKKNKSGSVSVQILQKQGRRNKLLKSIGNGYVQNKLEAIGVMIHRSIISELFDINMLNAKRSTVQTMQTIDIDPLLDNFKSSISYLIDNPSLADDSLIEIKLREFVQVLMR